MYTYFIQPEQGGPIKIGRAIDPRKRIANLQVGSPVKLRIIGLLDGDQEAVLHSRFQAIRLHGEWFRASSELTEFIKLECNRVLSDFVATEEKLKMEGIAVKIADSQKPIIGVSYFESVYKNDEDLQYNLIDGRDAFEWEVCSDCDCDESGDDCEYHAAAKIVDICDGEPFIETVGINSGQRILGFLCGPCNSHRKFEVLKSLSEHAFSLDCHREWTVFALFFDGQKQVGINLIALSLGCDYIFDPVVIFGESARLANFV